jgi:hypothetical protein
MKWLALVCFISGGLLLGFGLEIARVINWYLHFTATIPIWFAWGLLLFGFLLLLKPFLSFRFSSKKSFWC